MTDPSWGVALNGTGFGGKCHATAGSEGRPEPIEECMHEDA